MKVVLLSYGFDGTDVGEAFVAYKWAEALSHHVELTVLAFERQGRQPLKEQLPNANVVTWPEPTAFIKAERFNAMLKPAYPLLFWKVRQWLRAQKAKEQHFDLAHQIMPLAARYPSPFCRQNIPYIMGPLGGTLPTPEGFRKEVKTSQWYTRLRQMDGWRFRHDPWLRRSYSEAELVLGVAPYLEDALSSIPIRQFKTVLELGIDDMPSKQHTKPGHGLRLLHVGRGVRTKGLRDTVRALALLKDLPDDVVLTSAGGGEEIEICRKEAENLGVGNRVNFLGKISRSEVENLYQNSDVFVFPSFREPTGGVFYEAMRWGLPIITVDYGGPTAIVDDRTGIKLPLTTPKVLSYDIANAIRKLYFDPKLRKAMGTAARKYVSSQGLWANKAKRMMAIYEDVVDLRNDQVILRKIDGGQDLTTTD